MINRIKINELKELEFIKLFKNIFENGQWISEELYKKKPFKNFEDLSNKMLGIFENANKGKRLKILNEHPDLADKAKVLTSNSKKEQESAGLDFCTEQEINEFMHLNEQYKKKFGFPFILAVKGKNKNEILDNFRTRVSSSAKTELDESEKQVKLIVRSRLKELYNKNL